MLTRLLRACVGISLHQSWKYSYQAGGHHRTINISQPVPIYCQSARRYRLQHFRAPLLRNRQRVLNAAERLAYNTTVVKYDRISRHCCTTFPGCMSHATKFRLSVLDLQVTYNDWRSSF